MTTQQKIKLPDGATLVNEKPADPKYSDGRIVLVRWTKGSGRVEFVTWFWNDDCGGLSSGHYFLDLNDALDDFNARS